MQKQYNSKESESKWKNYWIKNKIFKFDKNSNKPIFSIDTPPPTVSGKLHMGHIGSMSQMDFIARYKRMQGYNLFYPFGTDDNGLATERLIEKTQKVKATKMPRKQFITLCLKTLVGIREEYLKGFKRLGLSCDWDIFYTTIDKHSQKISQKSFIDLYKQGREYRKQAPVIWCPTCQTAIAQVELEDKEINSHFNDIIFKIDSDDYIISTTRPELLPACVAVFVHPDDTRYKKLIGKKAQVPIFNYKVPIMADKRIEIEKGTGMMMSCTFGDQTDAELYMQYNLPLKIAISKNGVMTEIAGPYKGLSIRDAREQIIHDLKKQNLLTNQKEITHSVNVHERCGTEIEILETKQWFIKYLDLKQKYLTQGKKLNWYPKFMFNRYENWVKGLQWDWCISRQRFFGVPIPVWYCKKCGEVILAKESQLPVDPIVDKPKTPCPKCKSNEFVPEKDVLDTWATSSLTPRLAIELLPKKYWDKLYPMSLRPQAHDIITFWLFNTLVKSHFHFKTNPWKDVMISGFVLDPKGRKMSKSKGNIIEPQKMIEKYSADCLRFWAASTKLGDDSPFQEKELVAGQKFITKLWNASKFAFMHLKDYESKPKTLEPIDKWILSELSQIIKISTEKFDNYEYSRTKAEVENFFQKRFCDNYLEIIKDRLYNPDKRGEQSRLSAQYTLYTSVLAILKLIAPITPYITEEIYQNFYKKQIKEKSIHITNWPKPILQDKKAEKIGNLFIEILSKVRQEKNKQGKSLKTEIILTIPERDYKIIKPAIEDLKAVTKATEIKQGKLKIELQ